MGKIEDWFWRPFIQAGEWIKSGPDHEKDVVIEPEFEEVNNPVIIYKPTTFEQYIGQKKAKNILQEAILGTKDRNEPFPHTLIYGPAGCGKTTLAEIIAKEIGCQFTELITSQLKDPTDLFLKISDVEGGIVFLDEIHAIPRDTAESIYTIMEYFKYEGVDIKPFTLIGATTELGEILKDRRPFYERFILPIELSPYTNGEIEIIVRQYKDNAYAQDTLEDNVYEIISQNSRNTPRTARRLLKLSIYFGGNINKVLYNFNIIKEGYTTQDLKVLKYVARNEKGVGLQGLASYLDTSTANYTYDIEPYLLRNDLLIRTPRGRKITEEGLLKITELQNEMDMNEESIC